MKAGVTGVKVMNLVTSWGAFTGASRGQTVSLRRHRKMILRAAPLTLVAASVTYRRTRATGVPTIMPVTLLGLCMDVLRELIAIRMIDANVQNQN
jgi:hypothetical protein